MKLTKEQRHIAYVIMLEEAKAQLRAVSGKEPWEQSSSLKGLCDLCEVTFDFRPKRFGWSTDWAPLWSDIFPEIHNNAPVKLGYWWPTTILGWKKRILLLKQSIKATEY